MSRSRDVDQHSLLDLALMADAITCVQALRALGCPEREDCNSFFYRLFNVAADADPAIRNDRLTRLRRQKVPNFCHSFLSTYLILLNCAPNKARCRLTA